MSKPPISRTRHNLGESFLFLLDDIRQKIEETWTGSTQTPSAMLQMQYSDFVAWLYGPRTKPAAPGAGIEGPAVAHALDHALRNGATGTAHEIVAQSDLRQWAAGASAARPSPPDIEPEGLEL